MEKSKLTNRLDAYSWYVSPSATMQFALSMLEKRQGENIKIMKNTKFVEHGSNEADEMQADTSLTTVTPNRTALLRGLDRTS